MENENKDLQGGAEESELQEKVRQDISSKIAEAAAEIQEDIESAEAEVTGAVAEAGDPAETGVNEAGEYGEEADAYPEDDPFVAYSAEGASDGEDDSWSDEAFAEPPKEPKKVSMTVSNLVLSLIGTAVAGALILFLCLQIPGWIESMPEGKKIASVDGTEITDLDMKYYIYRAGMDYYQNDDSEGTTSSPVDYDWEKTAEDGRKVSEIVKENAVENAVGEVLLMNAGDKNGIEWNEQEELEAAQAQNQQLINIYGEELVELNAKAQGLDTIKQYNRKIVQAEHMKAVQADMEENPSKYYPEDTSVLNQYAPTDKATVKHILIKTESDDAAAAEGEGEGESAEAAPAEDKRAKAESVLSRAKSGEDFDALVKEFNEDTGATDAGYTFGPGEMMPAFEEAAFKLKLNDISDLVETSYGYHIIKRIPGQYELQGYWKDQAKVKVNQGMIDKMSIKDIMSAIVTASNDFQTKYSEQQGAQTSGSGASGSGSGSAGK